MACTDMGCTSSTSGSSGTVPFSPKLGHERFSCVWPKTISGPLPTRLLCAAALRLIFLISSLLWLLAGEADACAKAAAAPREMGSGASGASGAAEGAADAMRVVCGVEEAEEDEDGDEATVMGALALAAEGTEPPPTVPRNVRLRNPAFFSSRPLSSTEATRGMDLARALLLRPGGRVAAGEQDRERERGERNKEKGTRRKKTLERACIAYR